MSESVFILSRVLILRGGQRAVLPVQAFATKQLAQERMANDKQVLEAMLKAARVAVPSPLSPGGLRDAGPLMGFLMNEFGIEGYDQALAEAPVKSSNIEVVPGSIITKH